MVDDSILNLYGDKMQNLAGTQGVDISSQRMDDLDRKCLQFALEQKSDDLAAVDLGCGLGVQGTRLALTGIKTLLIDSNDIGNRVAQCAGLLNLQNIKFLQKDARLLLPQDLPEKIQILYSQRFIHYLKFEEAEALIKMMAEKMETGGRVFLSASGIDTELAVGYRDREKAVHDRYSPLNKEIALKHQIHEPVCLYSEMDLKQLLEAHGFKEVLVWSSEFGNIKAIFERV
ncbi:MAG: class I SAM-dependent methyltransferase [Nitrospinae bacterium]|jgi:hypothetical protein|nr:class I SAM-dependent methyltransferase [Nitrospinota bacterium]MDA1108554.1 class I SAM-dependent methyltransferase [Nitrospinota bacterium]